MGQGQAYPGAIDIFETTNGDNSDIGQKSIAVDKINTN